ncbi:hypothetical protein GCM10009555_057110 [Acrocarpospora macrocephala]|uniref:ABC3 transporter permease protein domain-containing protein n=1 Tax=Acrocarpospora macrocephala TaxID=150177 RepID=A0A5M3WNS5_9ACTN|nr:FtsX-like permease family protein [Acrocarpospora macrocephala]GES08403.1 hypothetical protein Amac_019990 [Acrocarpospora macrocephala]
MIVTIVLFIVVLGIPAALMCGSVFLAARSTSPLVRPGYLLWGAILAAIGYAVMAHTASATYEDQHYDDFGSLGTVLLGFLGAGVFLLGLGPFIPWLLRMFERLAVRLPVPFRLAARDTGERPVLTTTAVAMTMMITAVTVAALIASAARTAMNELEYQPRARPGALLVDEFRNDQAAAVQAAVQRELPTVSIVPSNGENDSGYFIAEVTDGLLADPVHVGDPALLRYLTGDPSAPFREDTAVVVTAEDVAISSVPIVHNLSGDHGDYAAYPRKTIPAVIARPADPHVEAIFIPSKVIQDLGFHLVPRQLIVDPGVHRISPLEQERLEERLGGTATVYVERGFQPATGWQAFVAVMAVIALGSALLATGWTSAESRSTRVLLRVRGGSSAALRRLAACRAGIATACGTVLGATAGCAIGLLLRWPLTTSAEWDPIKRPPFPVPWPVIAELAIGLPLLAAAIAALLTPRRTAET